jgi:hypothetical protein
MTSRLGVIILVGALATSLLTSARYWSATWCQEGVLEILGTRGSVHLRASPTSLRVSLSAGELSLTRCSWLGDPELSWQSRRRSVLDDQRVGTQHTVYMRAQRQGDVWSTSWRASVPHAPWRPLKTLFSALSAP